MSPLKAKARLREHCLLLRAQMSDEDVACKGARVVSNAMELLRQKPFQKFGLYASHGHEVPTTALAVSLRASGGIVFYPRWQGGQLLFLPVKDEAQMVSGAFGILEPVGAQAEPTASLDCVVVPGIAFDERGYRIGFGKGCYDQALQGYVGLKMGLAFEVQVVAKIPEEEHDIACDVIVTEERVMTAGKYGSRHASQGGF